MSNKIKPIEYSEHLCFKCLNEHDHINTYAIYGRGYGSSFDNVSTKLQLCNQCNKDDLKEWFDEYCNGEFPENYKYVDNIYDFVKTLPIQGRELFENSMSNGACSHSMDAQDWIDIELGIAPDEVYKKNCMYSPSEIKAYEERFPTCKEVYLKIYSDGSGGCRCRFGSHGNKDGSCDSNVSDNCYKCKSYKKKDIDEKLKEIKDFKLTKDDINIIKMYEWTCPKCGKINHTYNYEDYDYCSECSTYVDFDLDEEWNK